MRFGSQRRPSRMSTVVTTSTSSCVKARSGAESQAKVMQVASPAPLNKTSAASRWNLACQAAATAQTIPTTQSAANAGSTPEKVRRPGWKPEL